jgi:hypothetical protein
MRNTTYVGFPAPDELLLRTGCNFADVRYHFVRKQLRQTLKRTSKNFRMLHANMCVQLGGPIRIEYSECAGAMFVARRGRVYGGPWC